jgi:iron complex outermembrane receptor protein
MKAMRTSLQLTRSALLAATALMAWPAMAQGAGDAAEAQTATGAAAQPAAAATAESPDEASGTGIGEIIVTAQRREENLQSVPIAVTALTAESLRANRVQTIQDLSGLAPGLTIVTNSGGQNSATVSLRGVTSTAFFPGQSSGVSTYIDGVYLGSINATVTDLADIERIEVLRGPQGTLFGRNANGGAISITTTNPKGEFGARQELSYGNYDYLRSKTQVELPRLGPFTATLTYLHSERRGDIRNLGAGTQWDWTTATNGVWGIRTSPKYLGNRNTEGFAAKLRFEPTSEIGVTYKFDYTDTHYTDQGNGILTFGDTPSGALNPYSQLAFALYSRVPVELRTPISRERPKAVNNWFVTPAHQKQYGHALIATYTPSEVVTLRNILSYRNNKVSGNSNLDALGGTTGITGVFGTTGAPVVFTGAAFYNPESQLTNETQVNLTTKLFDLTAGFFYFDGKAGNGPAGLVPGRGGPPYSGNYFFTDLVQPYNLQIKGTFRTSIKTKSNAVFAQGAFHLTDQLDLLAGIRHTWDHIYGVDNGSSPALVDIRYNFKSEKTTWLAGVTFKASDDLLLYAKASTGYISGGAVGGITYNSEDAISYEAGLKADFGRRLRANLAIYQADYDGLQGVGFINGTTPAVFNIADARVRGVEAEVTWIPTQGLTLSTGLGYSDFEYRAVDPKFLALNRTNSDRLLKPRRPKLVGNGSVQYETPTMAWGGTILARVDGILRSSEDLATFYTGPTSRDQLKQKGTVLVNGRVALTDLNFGPATVEAAVWARNLTNVKALRGVINASAVYSANYEPARTYGIDLITRF